MRRKKTRVPQPPSKCVICEADLTGKNSVIMPGIGETCMDGIDGPCQRAGRELREQRYKNLAEQKSASLFD